MLGEDTLPSEYHNQASDTLPTASLNEVVPHWSGLNHPTQTESDFDNIDHTIPYCTHLTHKPHPYAPHSTPRHPRRPTEHTPPRARPIDP